MIRRHYILRMIEEFIRARARINSLKPGQRWNEAGEALDDEFCAMLDAAPDNERLVEFGCAFYRRLLTQSDTALNVANLRRTEVEEGLKELEARRKP